MSNNPQKVWAFIICSVHSHHNHWFQSSQGSLEKRLAGLISPYDNVFPQRDLEDFPGRPGVKTTLNCRGCGFDPWWANFHMQHGLAPPPKKEENLDYSSVNRLQVYESV